METLLLFILLNYFIQLYKVCLLHFTELCFIVFGLFYFILQNFAPTLLVLSFILKINATEH